MKNVYEIYLNTSFGSERIAVVSSKAKAIDYIMANREKNLDLICYDLKGRYRYIKYGDKMCEYLNSKELLNWYFAINILTSLRVKAIEVI